MKILCCEGVVLPCEGVGKWVVSGNEGVNRRRGICGFLSVSLYVWYIRRGECSDQLSIQVTVILESIFRCCCR